MEKDWGLYFISVLKYNIRKEKITYGWYESIFNLIDDFAIVVVDYNNGNIIYMNDEARQKYLLIWKLWIFQKQEWIAESYRQ